MNLKTDVRSLTPDICKNNYSLYNPSDTATIVPR